MKTIFKFFAIALIAFSVTSCYRTQPDAGEESVLVKKPLFFGHGGVELEPISTGATWCVWTTDHYEFKITPTTITEEFENMIPSDNTPVSFSAHLKCQIQSGKTPILYQEFGLEWYANSLQSTFRTMVRDYASGYTMFQLANQRKISATLEKQLYNDLKAYAEKLHLPVTIMQVSIGQITPPSEVLRETKLTAAQNQSILTQESRAKAELSRKQAEINKAIADKAYQIQMAMTVGEYLHLRQLEIEKEKVELIKDNKNVSIIFGQSVPTTFPIK